MPLPAYLVMDPIKGGFNPPQSAHPDLKRLNGAMVVTAVVHEMGSDDAGVIHGLMKVTKDFDLATPDLQSAAAQGKKMDTAFLHFFRTGRGGDFTEEPSLTISLTGVKIVSTKLEHPSVRNPGTQNLPEQETIDLSYESIKWDAKGPKGQGSSTGKQVMVDRTGDEAELKYRNLVLGGIESIGEEVVSILKRIGTKVAAEADGLKEKAVEDAGLPAKPKTD
jgi:type VI secretion system Hcp family effector